MKCINRLRRNAGVSLIEVIVVFGLFLLLIGLGSVSTGRITQTVSLQSTYDELTAAVANQQQQAMTGYDRAGNSNSTYGIRFEPDRYILFTGSTYSADDADNVITDLPQTLSFSTIDLPAQQIVFMAGNGQVAGYDAAHDTIVLSDSVTGDSRTLEWNTLGVFTQ